jgi:hypothetical protein
VASKALESGRDLQAGEKCHESRAVTDEKMMGFSPYDGQSYKTNATCKKTKTRRGTNQTGPAATDIG